MKHFRTDVKTFQKPGDLGPVTQADLEINEMLEGTLRGARSGYGWLSEENEDNGERLDAERVFIVDPIDGTRSFIAGEAGFSVALAIADRGRVTAAAVYLPVRDEMYSAVIGQGAEMNGAVLTASDKQNVSAATVLTANKQMQPENWPGGPPPMTRHFRSSLAWRMCLVASARFDTMLTFRRAFEWDIAAGTLIAGEAGAHVTDGDGRAMRFNSPEAMQEGVVAAPIALHRQIMTHRIPRD